MFKEEMLTQVVDAPETVTEMVYQSDYELERNKPMPNRVHGVIQNNVGSYLKFTYGNRLQFVNELSLDTTPGSTPDICIYPKKKLDIWATEAKETEPPLTAIEIVSPSQSLNEIIRKVRDLYFPIGVQSAWVVVPELKGIHILLPGKKSTYFDAGNLIDPTTGVEIPIEKVFEDIV